MKLRQAVVCFAVAVLLFPVPPLWAQDWTQLFPTGGPPTNRQVHTAVLNAASDRMVVFGGQPGGCCSQLNDTWVLSSADGAGGTPTWSELSPIGSPPAPRGVQTAIFDSSSDTMVIFGGDLAQGSCGAVANDVWSLTGADGLGGTPTWTQLFPIGGSPAGRASHTAVYDSTNNRMIVFAGDASACASYLNDVWVLTNANGQGGTPTWVQLFPTGGPSARASHVAVYDEASNRMIVFGGNSFGVLQNDTWVLSNANGLGGTPTWTQLAPAGILPPALGDPTAVYDPSTNRMTVFAGYANPPGARVNTVWTLSNANGLGGTPAWTQLAPTGGPPTARVYHTAVFNPANAVMTIFAGSGDGSTLGDTWILDHADGVVQTATSTSVGSSANPAVFGQSVVLTVTVAPASGSGTPTGTVTFQDGATTIATQALSGGQASVTISNFSVGSHSITATYGGDTNFTGSASPAFSQTVNKAGTTTAIATSANPSSLNQSVTFTATVTVVSPGAGTSSGTVTFADGAATLANVALGPSGQAVLSTSALSAGGHAISASYSGDGNFNGSAAALTQQVQYEPAGTLCDGDYGHQILSPISAGGNSVFKQGRTVPAKFRVCDANGVSVATPGVVSSFYLTAIITGTATTDVLDLVDSTTPDAAFRWDLTNQQWIFNISTSNLSANSTYVYAVTLNDGTTINFQYGLR